MRPDQEHKNQPSFYVSKDHMGELLEDTVQLVLESLRPLSLFQRLGDLVTHGLSPIEVYQDLPGIILEELPVTRVSLMKAVSEGELEVIAAQDRWTKGPPDEKGWRPQDRTAIGGNGKTLFAKAWKAKEVWVENLPPDERGVSQRFISVPFSVRDEEEGLICLLSHAHRPLEPHHLAVWTLLSNLFSLVLGAVSALHGQRLWNRLLEDRVLERTRALMESEAKYRDLVENMADTIFTMDAEGRLNFVSPQAEALTGYSLNQLREMTLEDLVDPEDVSFLRRQIGMQASGEAPGPLDISIRTVDGTLAHLEVNISHTFGRNGEMTGFQGIARDVTEREQLKRQLQHAQKMEAIGTLAGGMAHEFNNILAAIQGYAQLLSMNLSKNDPLAEYVNNIDVSCQRAAGLTRKILTFSRLEGGNEVPVKLTRVVKEVQQLLRQTISPQITLESKLDPRLPFVLADPAQLEQVLLNLGVNARDDMPEGGIIRFETQVMQLDQSFCRCHPWAKPGRYVEVMVKDTGRGMTPEVLERAFDPFFTTKEPGKGTGLGLSIAYSIVKNHGGYILAESQVNRGSCFKIYLPVFEELVGETTTSSELGHHPRGRGESVLVVDDEPQFREIIENMLVSSGYRVAGAAQGEEAINLCRMGLESGRRYDLIILDLAMPVMSGETYLRKLLKLDPEARVLIATGYGEEHLALHELGSSVSGILHKPFDLEALLKEVRQALDGQPTT